MVHMDLPFIIDISSRTLEVYLTRMSDVVDTVQGS